MQNIGVIRENEGGERLAEFDPDGIDLRIVKAAPNTSVCLRFIDPYGDLVINQLQLPVLIGELRQLHGRSEEADLREHIERLIRFLTESAETHVHTRFLGD